MNTAPLDNAASFIQQLDKLQEELQKQLPGYESSLRDIHRAISDDPAMLHVITPDQIGIIVAGLKKKTGQVITEEIMKKKGTASGKKLKDVTLDDI